MQSQNQSCKKTFTQIVLSYLWPIARHELPKFLSVTLLLFCILFIQNLIRALKDGIVISMIGTETIAILKLAVLPVAFLMTILYMKLVNFMKGEYIFYLIFSIFLAFFAIFAFVIFPNYEAFHIDTEFTKSLLLSYPHFKWFILLISKWSFSVFYIISELWPSFVFGLLFWQFVNAVNTVEESKRFYALFGLLGQTGLIISGWMLENLSSIRQYFTQHFGITSNVNTACVQVMLSTVLLLGFVGLITFWLLNNKILTSNPDIKFRAKQKSMSIAESLKMIMNSRYIRLIAILLICYGTSINLVEAPWKAEASKVYQGIEAFTAFMGGYLKYTGICTIALVLVGSNIVRRVGWLVAAIVTPLMVLCTGALFFCVSNSSQFAAMTMLFLGLSDPATIAISFGAIQNVLSKSSKYTLFDATKEMAYVPLPDELKTRGKAAAEIGTKLGKSSSALFQGIIFTLFPAATYQSISIYLMCLFVIICIIWIWAVIELGAEYKLATASPSE